MGLGFAAVSVPNGFSVPFIFVFYLRADFPKLRIKMLYMIMNIPCPPKRDIKQAAKDIKKCLVLIKQKLQRGQVCRSYPFRKLMALVYDPEEHQDKGLSKIAQHTVFPWGHFCSLLFFNTTQV